MAGYKQQVALLVEIIPEIEKVPVFALHGGTAINLFIRNMPRLSVDIDLTYVKTEGRMSAFTNIKKGLMLIQNNILKQIPNAKVNYLEEQLKIQVSKDGAIVKIEVNQGIRGVIDDVEELVLCDKAQEEFASFCSISGVPLGQLYGGKICAALDRQHPRDLFDVHYMLKNEGITDSIKKGFLFTLLSTGRSLYDVLYPNKLDHKETFKTQFEGMTKDSFTYDDYQETRTRLYASLHKELTEEDRRFILNFKKGKPDWDYLDFSKFPAIQWKLQNILKLKDKNTKKHSELVKRLEDALIL